MANSPYKTFGDIYTAALQDFKENTSSNMVTMVKRWINEGQEQVIMRKKRDYLNKTYSIRLEDSATCTFSVTKGSVTVTRISGATLPSGVQDHKFKIIGFDEVYDIDSLSSTTITLASAYAGTTNTAASGVVFQSALYIDPEIRSIHKLYHERNGQVIVLNKGPEDFRNIVQTDPGNLDYAQYWTLYGYNSVSVASTDDKRRLQFYPYPKNTYTIHIDANIHIPMLTSSTDEPIIPIQYRQVLYWFAVMKLAQYHQDSEMLQFGTSNFNSWLERMDGEFMPERDLPSIRYDNTRWMNRNRFKIKIKFD